MAEPAAVHTHAHALTTEEVCTTPTLSETSPNKKKQQPHKISEIVILRKQEQVLENGDNNKVAAVPHLSQSPSETVSETLLT